MNSGSAARRDPVTLGGGLARCAATNPMAAAPLLGKLGSIASEIALAARATTFSTPTRRKPSCSPPWRRVAAVLDLAPARHHRRLHFAPAQRRLQVALANRLACDHRALRRGGGAFVGAGGRRDRLEVVPNGVDLVRMRSRRRRCDRSWPAHRRLAGVFSGLRLEGQHVVLDALRKVPDLHCIIAGDALFARGYAALKDMVDAAQLGDRVHFLAIAMTSVG